MSIAVWRLRALEIWSRTRFWSLPFDVRARQLPFARSRGPGARNGYKGPRTPRPPHSFLRQCRSRLAVRHFPVGQAQARQFPPLASVITSDERARLGRGARPASRVAARLNRSRRPPRRCLRCRIPDVPAELFELAEKSGSGCSNPPVPNCSNFTCTTLTKCQCFLSLQPPTERVTKCSYLTAVESRRSFGAIPVTCVTDMRFGELSVPIVQESFFQSLSENDGELSAPQGQLGHSPLTCRTTETRLESDIRNVHPRVAR